MKLCLSPSPTARRGVALVVTLILLSVILVITLALLAVSRRERSSVNTAQELIDAQFMTTAAAERAKATIGAQILGDLHLPSGAWARTMRGLKEPTEFRISGNLLVTTSTNSLDPAAYTPTYINSLQYDARVPVFVPTNRQAGRVDYDFRHFLDLNRNGVFETNGFFYPIDKAGAPIKPDYYYQSGDPEWIGVLENPQFPHSSSNRFIGRYAFLVVPAGRTLDINTIHNNARNADMVANTGDGYNRNQGVATFELNLAAFLADLNTNYWAGGNTIYDFDIPKPWGQGNGKAAGRTFDLARSLLRYRYNGSQTNLPTIGEWLGGDAARSLRMTAAFGRDNYDTFGDDDVQTVLDRAAGIPSLDVELGRSPLETDRWPGVENPQQFTTINSLFKARSNDVVKAPYFGEFVNDLKAASKNTDVRSSPYNHYTYYRLLSQLGTDTGSGTTTNINLNYKNTDGTNLEDYLTWIPTNFFMTVGDRLFKSQFASVDLTNDWFSENFAYRFNTAQGPGPVSTNLRSYYALPGAYGILSGLQVPVLRATNFPQITALSTTNIPLYPTNYYNVAVHRLLQLSANLYAATNPENYRVSAGGATNSAPYLPIIYRPILQRSGASTVRIAGYTTDFGDALINRPWHSLSELSDPAVNLNDNFYGLSPIVEARKGFPSLNEFAVASAFNVTRKLLLTKNAATDKLDSKNLSPTSYSELLILSGTNRLGVELLNPYRGAYPRPLRAQIQGRIYTALMNGSAVLGTWTNSYTNIWKMDAGKWKGETLDVSVTALQVPLLTNIVVTTPAYISSSGLATNLTTPFYEKGQLISLHTNYNLTVRMTNEFSYVLIDMQGPDRVVDVVSMNRLESVLPISQTLEGDGLDGKFWNTTNTVSGGKVPLGIYEQIIVSQNPSAMKTHGATDFGPGLGTLALEATAFAGFMEGAVGFTNLQKQTPFTPGGIVFKVSSWQVNDPLLHHIPEHFYQPASPGLGVKLSLDVGSVSRGELSKLGDLQALLNNNLNIGKVNNGDVFTRWGYAPGIDQGKDATTNDLFTVFNPQTRDPLVRTPDDWNFPSGKYPALGWIGKVHRGTPWQSVYLKSGVASERWLLDARFDVMKIWPVDAKGTWTSVPTFLNHPTNDWMLADLFTTSPSTVAGIGAIGVNQDGIAAWSAVLSGVVVRTNNLSAVQSKLRVLKNQPPAFGFLSIQPAMGSLDSPLYRVVDGINRARAGFPHGTFASVGHLLSVPELTIASPFLRTADPKDTKRDDYRFGVDDESYEWIPHQILSLVRSDEPRYVIYSFGQALRPAADSLIKDPVSPHYNLCTNYQIVAESATKTVMRFEHTDIIRTNRFVAPVEIRLRPVVESFQTLPDESF